VHVGPATCGSPARVVCCTLDGLGRLHGRLLIEQPAVSGATPPARIDAPVFSLPAIGLQHQSNKRIGSFGHERLLLSRKTQAAV
jgi:hypothetical protein